MSFELLAILLIFPLCLWLDRRLVKQGMGAGKRLAIECLVGLAFLAALLVAKSAGLL